MRQGEKIWLGVILSLLIHALVVSGFLIRWPFLSPAPLVDVSYPIPVEIVALDTLTKAPKPRPQVEKKPTPPPAKPAPALPVEPVVKPEPEIEKLPHLPDPEPALEPELKAELNPVPPMPEAPLPAPKSEAPPVPEKQKKPAEKPKKPVEKPKKLPEKPKKSEKKQKDLNAVLKQIQKESKKEKDSFESILKNLQNTQEDPVSQASETDIDSLSRNAAPNTDGQQLSISEMDALKRQLASCWNIPAGARDAQDLVVVVQVQIAPDGMVTQATLRSGPQSRHPFYQVAADAALRALRSPPCSPLKLPADRHDVWKNMEITFNPKEMLR